MPAALHVHVRDHLADILDDALFDVIAVLIVIVAAVTLIAHLADHAVLALSRLQKLALAERMRKRLFDEHRLAETHRVHRRAEMGVIGNADEHRVDFAGHAVEHDPEILKTRKVGIFLERFKRMRSADIGIAQCHDLADVGIFSESFKIVPRLRTAADRRQANLAVDHIGAGRETPREHRKRPGGEH